MEAGFDFVWRANCRPVSRDAEGNEIYMDVKDNVPYLQSWKENVAFHARRIQSPLTPMPTEKFGLGAIDSQQLAKKLLDDNEFSCKSFLKLLQPLKCKPAKSNRLSVSNKVKSEGKTVEYMVLGAFAHTGVQGITNPTNKNTATNARASAWDAEHATKAPKRPTAAGRESAGLRRSPCCPRSFCFPWNLGYL